MCIDLIYYYVEFSVGGTNSLEAPEVQDKLAGKKKRTNTPSFCLFCPKVSLLSKQRRMSVGY